MNEVKVYHSVWKDAITILTDLLIVTFCAWTIRKGFTPVISWYLAIFFCIAALVTAYPLLKERITKRPCLTITDESVHVSGGKSQVIRFADVESFVLKRFIVSALIEINYINERATPGAILASDLTLKPKELLEILNERLAASKNG